MADRTPLDALRESLATPIAQLNPEIADAKSRVIDGVVTITWPYSTVTKSIAFILAEHDILIRRKRGQIRVELRGASGQAFADANIGGGDQLRISLDGAQWTNNDAKTGLPAGSLEWQLNFTSRLLLSIRRVESEGPDVIDVSASEDLVDGVLEPRPDSRITPPPASVGVEDREEISTPFAQSSHSTVPLKRLASNTFEPEEYASPAFIKRARVSYGSLFEGELDLFGDDKEKNKKSRRKSRFSMGNAVWRYSSRSPSPETKELSEPESLENESTEEIRATADSRQIIPTPQRSAMVDEGCQTQEYDFTSSMHVQVSAEAHFPELELTASPTPGLFPERGPSLHTPSRNLFSRSQLHDEVSDVATEPLDSHVATSQHNHSFGLGLSTTHADIVPNAFGTVSAPPELMGSHERLLEATVGPSYPDFATTDQVYAEPMMRHDPNLHFQEHDVHSTNHGYQHVSQRESPTWHSEVVSSYPPLPSERQDSQAAVIMDSSPPPEVEASRGTGFRTSQTPEEDDEAPQDQEASPIAGQASTLGQEQSDSEDDGGDIEGEDYDLRNYSHTRDDDESVSEKGSDAPGSDVDEQAIDSEEDGDTSEDEGDEREEDVRITQHRGFPDREQEEFAGSEDDELAEVEEEEEQFYDEEGMDEENGYDEDEELEEEYDEEDYDEEEEDAVDHLSAPDNPREPVCIDLISDSEDEEKDDEPPNEEPRDMMRGELDQREDETSPYEEEKNEQVIKEPTTTRHPGDSEVEEEGGESEPVADEVTEGEPIQPSTASHDVEAVSVTGKQEEHDEMDVDEVSSEPANQNAVEETEMFGTAVQQTTKDDTREKAWHEEDATEASPVEDAGNTPHEADVSEEQTVTQEPSTDMADVKTIEPLPAVDIQGPAAKLGEPAVEQEPKQQTEKTEAAKNIQLSTPPETQALEKTTEPSPAQEMEVGKEYDDSAAAEDQIMKEYREYQSPTYKGSTAHVKPGAEAATEAPEQGQSQEFEVLITAASLRNRRQSHYKTQSADSTSSAPRDPSVLLAQASSQNRSDEVEPEPEPGNEPSSPHMLRIIRSTKPDHPDPSILLAKWSAEPSKRDETPGPTVRVTRSMTGHSEEPSSPIGTRMSRRAATPETQTTHRDDQVLVSPSISGSFVEDESLSTLKRQLQKDLRTKLPDHVPLRSLRTFLNKTVDVLAVATSTPPQPHRPKHGPRDYMLELTLADPSSAPSGVCAAHIFRPHQASLPVVHIGDVVLLRRVTVVSMKGRGFGFRVSDASAWAVFEMGDDEMLPQIKGPPVEVTDEEVEYAGGLRKWWGVLDEAARGKIDKATQKVVG
ncbi:Telomere end binding protein, partial [Metarhizium majus ARSEF 297]